MPEPKITRSHEMPLAHRVYGSPTHCATCDRDRTCTHLASNPKDRKAGRWHVCDSCRYAATDKHHCGLRYEPVEEVRRAG